MNFGDEAGNVPPANADTTTISTMASVAITTAAASVTLPPASTVTTCGAESLETTAATAPVVTSAAIETGASGGARTKNLTEKGRQFKLDQTVKNFQNTNKRLKSFITQNCKKIGKGDFTIESLFQGRVSLEEIMERLSQLYYEIRELSIDEFNGLKETFDDCQARSAAALSEITQVIRNLNNEDRKSLSSRNSRRSKSSSSSSGSKRSNKSSNSSVTSAKVAAAAKAAALRTKLKYHEIEEKHRVELDKLQLIRDIEVEEAKVAAIVEIEAGANPVTSEGNLTQSLVTSNLTQTFTCESNVVRINAPVNAQARVSPPLFDVSGPQGVHTSIVGPSVSGQSVPNVSRVYNSRQSTGDVTKLTQSIIAPIHSLQATGYTPQSYLPVSNISDPAQNQPAAGNVPLNVYAPQFEPAATHKQSHSLSNCSDMDRLIKAFGDCVNISRLPPPEPGVFTGDPLQYPSWRSAFGTLIESRDIPSAERVHYLNRYIGGKAKQCIESYLLIPTAESYHDAMKLIDDRFGDNFTIARAFKNKIEAWPKIAAKDSQGLSFCGLSETMRSRLSYKCQFKSS